MGREDGRKISREGLEERRKIIIRMGQQGKSIKDIVEAVGMTHTTVRRVLHRLQEQGIQYATKGKPRGRKPGAQRTLDNLQEAEIRKKIIDKRPEQMKLDFTLWTREAVRMLLQQEYGIAMPVRTVGLYLQRWGFTPQKPVKVKAWLEEAFPVIKAKAKQQRGEVYWGDETGLRAGDVRARGYAPKGKTPVVRLRQSMRI